MRPRGEDSPESIRASPRFQATTLAAFAVLALASVAQAQPPSQRALLEQHKCYECHGDRDAKTGPSYADVAERYRKTPHAVAHLAAIIRNGTRGSGPWHMPPHPEISKAEALRMARYVLSVQ